MKKIKMKRKNIDNKDKSEAIVADGNEDQTINHEEKDETNDVQLEEEIIEDDSKDDKSKDGCTTKTGKEKGIESKPVTEVRKSQRIRKQRMVIQPDQTGDCDDTKDMDYK